MVTRQQISKPKILLKEKINFVEIYLERFTVFCNSIRKLGVLNSTILPMTTTQLQQIDDSAADFATYIGQKKCTCQEKFWTCRHPEVLPQRGPEKDTSYLYYKGNDASKLVHVSTLSHNEFPLCSDQFSMLTRGFKRWHKLVNELHKNLDLRSWELNNVNCQEIHQDVCRCFITCMQMASTYLLSCDITEVYWWLECKRAALCALSKSKCKYTLIYFFNINM